ncbi:MAG TPA: hypothetical protein VLH84_00390 [Patescibacteria group bacterium]|nr:hypothetical protein [Patescibacteria group bacterium]
MTEFSATFYPVNLDVLEGFPPEAAMTVYPAGQQPTEVFPFGFRHDDVRGPQLVARLVVGRAIALIGLGTSHLGIYPTPRGQQPPPNDGIARISLRYYKPTEDGTPESRYRDLEIHPGTPSICYGVHPDHPGETPTWYVRGRHVGFSRRGDGGANLVPGARFVRPPQIKSFSIARIVDGPLGDPSTDEVFRMVMGIPEIRPA